jgi:hypothetical protein
MGGYHVWLPCVVAMCGCHVWLLCVVAKGGCHELYTYLATFFLAFSPFLLFSSPILPRSLTSTIVQLHLSQLPLYTTLLPIPTMGKGCISLIFVLLFLPSEFFLFAFSNTYLVLIYYMWWELCSISFILKELILFG